MRNSPTNLMRWVCSMLALCALTLLAACGGGGISNSASSATSVGDATDLKTVLAAVPAAGGGGGGGANVVRLYYNRPDAAYGGWTLYTYGGADLGGWPGKVPDGDDASAGKYWDITVTGPSFNFIIVKDGGGTREPSGWSGANNDQQQFWALADGKSIYKVAGDKTNYTSNPAGAATPDIETVRVHYKRFDGQYSNWGVHIWDGSGLDVSRLKAGVTINEWTNAVPFTDFNNYATGSGEIVFDIPVLNPVADPTRTNLQFIIHGKPPGGDANDKDGRNDNISVSYAALKIAGKVGEVWMIQGDATVYTAFPDTRLASTTDARAFWLNKSLIQFPKIGNGGVFKLYHSARGQIKAARDEAVTGADGSITLDIFGGIVPARRFHTLQVRGCRRGAAGQEQRRRPVAHAAEEPARAGAGRRGGPGAERQHRPAARRAGRPVCGCRCRARPGRQHCRGPDALQALGTHGAESFGGALQQRPGPDLYPAAGHL
jgi:pullulanase